MADEPEAADQDQDDERVGQTAPSAGEPARAVDSPAAGPAMTRREADLSPGDVELLLKQAEQALASVENPVGDEPPGLKPFQLDDLVGTAAASERATLDMLRDVDLELRIEFGRTHLYLEEVLKLRKGSVVPLDKLAGDPVDIFVNGRLIATGEILVLNDNFCVRVGELIAGETA